MKCCAIYLQFHDNLSVCSVMLDAIFVKMTANSHYEYKPRMPKKEISKLRIVTCEPGSSAGVVSDYGLDGAG